MRCGRSRDLLPRSAPKGPKREKRKFLMAINPEDLLGFELLDEPEDPPPPATLLVQSDRKVENKYNKTWWETKVTKRSEATKSAYSFIISIPS